MTPSADYSMHANLFYPKTIILSKCANCDQYFHIHWENSKLYASSFSIFEYVLSLSNLHWNPTRVGLVQTTQNSNFAFVASGVEFSTVQYLQTLNKPIIIPE